VQRLINGGRAMVVDQKKFIQAETSNEINIYKVPSEKFKTDAISVFLISDLTKDTATLNALFPAILKRGSKRFPTFKDISIRLEELYGATFDFTVYKKGELQIIQFYIDYIKDKYAQDSNLFQRVFDLLLDIITNPVTDGKKFKPEYFLQEKQNLSDLINGKINNKVSYASLRCYEEMCKDEAFGIYEYGDIKHLNNIKNKDLYEYYVNFLNTCNICAVASSNVQQSQLLEVIENGFSKFSRSNIQPFTISSVEKPVSSVKNVTEKMDINQAKLSMGFRTNVPANSENYYKLLVYNSILGEGVHSKLFRNVREAKSLAYYIYSALEKFKGLMLISSGIDPANKDIAVNTIIEQINDMQNEAVSDYEYDAAMKSLESATLSIRDNQLNLLNFYFNNWLAGVSRDINDVIKGIKSVSKDDIINISKNIKLDAIYFLTTL